MVLTAKATLLENPITRLLIRMVGVVPLRRASDAVSPGSNGVVDSTQNAEAFATVVDVLDSGGVVLLFPEGKSHSDPALAPLKTGLARMALMARAERRLSYIRGSAGPLRFCTACHCRCQPRGISATEIDYVAALHAFGPTFDSGGIRALTSVYTMIFCGYAVRLLRWTS